MESLKELLERRNKHVHDAREILARETKDHKLGADEAAKADELLDAAADLDGQIAERQKADDRKGRLTALEDRERQDARRTTAPGSPGADSRRGRVEPLVLEMGRHKVRVQPGTALHERSTDDYAERFANYLAGNYPGVNGHERLGLQVGDNSQGGYLVPMGMASGLVKFLDDNVFMRRLGTVLPPTTDKSVGVLSYDTDPNDADWTAEVPASDVSEDTATRFGSREMAPHLLTKLLKMSRKVLRSASLDLWGWMTQRVGYKFAITEEKAFLTGTGAQQPLGVFIADSNGITTSQDVTCASATTFTADELINVLFDLKEAYMMKATWLMSRTAVKVARKLKDSQNQYLWGGGLNSGTPGTILDRPIVMSEYVPSTFTTGLYVAAVGDWSHYWIQDGLNLEIQRLDELFSLRNQVGLLARKETDGHPVLAEAFRRLKLG